MPFEGPDDYIDVLSTDDVEKFDLTCEQLGNKHARDVLEQLKRGANAAADIAKNLDLTVQTVISHLNALEKIGLVESSKVEQLGNRGRVPRHYRITKVAVLLIPSQIGNDDGRTLITSMMKKKALDLLKKRLMVSALGAILITAGVFWYISSRISRLLFVSTFSYPLTALAVVISVSVGICAYFAIARLALRCVR